MDIEVIIGLGVTIGSVILAFVKTREAQLSGGVLIEFMEGFKDFEIAITDGTITDDEKIPIADHSISMYRKAKALITQKDEE